MSRNSIKSLSFFSGGNAIFTVSNPSGKHYTYRIRKPEPQSPFFIQLLKGPDNTNDFTYLGVYMPKENKVLLTRNSKMNENSLPVKVLKWALQCIAAGEGIPEGYTIQHEGKCCKCGRPLTVPESIENGIGPECAGTPKKKQQNSIISGDNGVDEFQFEPEVREALEKLMMNLETYAKKFSHLRALPLFSGRPIRETPIDNDDITNIKIELGRCEDVLVFIDSLISEINKNNS